MMQQVPSSPTSRSIPIVQRSSQIRRTLVEEAKDREGAAMADYVDFCFASRLVQGMQKKQSFTHDISLRYENQALIDHIIATRQSRAEECCGEIFPTTSRRNGVRMPPRTDSNDKLIPSSRYDDSLHEEDDMIFDMEL
jgi:hypothetical protein